MNEFKINNFIVKEELPVIALRDMALFPTLIVPLAIGRAKTLFALDKAMASDKLAVFVTQKKLRAVARRWMGATVCC